MLSKAACVLVTVSRFFAPAVAVATVTLNNGVKMPMMMIGTGGAPGDTGNSSETEANVRVAFHVGFTAVDTAHSYGVQDGVGRALAEVNRSSVFVSTKIGGSFYGEATAAAYNDSLREAYDNLKELNTDYVDLVMLHYPPIACVDSCAVMQEQWRALENFLSAGKTRAIGVSNYCQSDLACILETAVVVPAVNQVAFHVGMSPDPRGLVSYNDAHGILTFAYSPLGSYDFSHYPNVTKDISLITGNFTRDIGTSYNKSGAQVALRWLAQRGVPSVTVGSEKHLRQDLEVFEFSLSEAHMRLLDAATTPTGEPNLNIFGTPPCGSSSRVTTV